MNLLRRVPILMLALLAATTLARAADTAHGAQLYRSHCSGCHGNDGRPVMANAPDFTRATALLKPDPVLQAALRDGRGAMPAYRGQLSDRDMLDIVAHLRTLR